MTKRSIFKKGSTTFFYSSLFFPRAVREDVFTLYAYVRIVDDAVDQMPADLKLFESLWKDTKNGWQGKPVEKDIVKEFIALARKKRFSWEWIAAFWTAMRQDLIKHQYTSYEELDQYMYGSAEVIGLMMARILDLSENAYPAAAMQGKAMQLINFIRDIQEDEHLGRVYIPAVTIPVHKTKNWNRIVHEAIAAYRIIQSKAEEGYSYIPWRYRIPIQTAAQMYGWTARQIERDPTTVWRKKVKPSKLRIILTAIRNTITL